MLLLVVSVSVPVCSLPIAVLLIRATPRSMYESDWRAGKNIATFNVLC